MARRSAGPSTGGGEQEAASIFRGGRDVLSADPDAAPAALQEALVIYRPSPAGRIRTGPAAITRAGKVRVWSLRGAPAWSWFVEGLCQNVMRYPDGGGLPAVQRARRETVRQQARRPP